MFYSHLVTKQTSTFPLLIIKALQSLKLPNKLWRTRNVSSLTFSQNKATYLHISTYELITMVEELTVAQVSRNQRGNNRCCCMNEDNE